MHYSTGYNIAMMPVACSSPPNQQATHAPPGNVSPRTKRLLFKRNLLCRFVLFWASSHVVWRFAISLLASVLLLLLLDSPCPLQSEPRTAEEHRHTASEAQGFKRSLKTATHDDRIPRLKSSFSWHR
jgi:hypothetical protein